MNFKELVRKRRTRRQFLDRPVDRALIEELMGAARYSPTGMDLQNRTYYVLGNRDLMDRLAQALGQALGRKAYHFYQAPVLILPAVPKESGNGVQDVSCAMQNMMLMAEDLGLASCWINQFKHATEDDQVREVLGQLGIPGDQVVYCALALGYSDQVPGVKERTEEVFYID